MCCRADGSCVAVAEYHRPQAERPTPFVYISAVHLWLPALHLLQSRPPSISSPPDEPPSALPYRATTPTKRPSIVVSPSRSLLLSYQHHLARSGTQHAATPLLNRPPPPPPQLTVGWRLSLSHSCEGFCKRGCCSPAEFLLTCVFSLNYHRAWGGGP